MARDKRNYTTIQKAIARLLEDLLEEAARALAELVSSGDMDCVGWKDETGYGKRFPEEQEMAVLVNRFKDEIRARSRRVISKLLNARIVVHNLFTALLNKCHTLPI